MVSVSQLSRGREASFEREVPTAYPAEVAVVGATIQSSSISSLESLVRLAGSPGTPLMTGIPGVSEHAVLKTCNRVEFYLASNSPRQAAEELQARVAKAMQAIEPPPLSVHRGLPAVRHLFEVAAGLDSVVLGEAQILSQVRSAGVQARMEGSAKGVLSPLFDRAVRVGQRVRGAYPLNEAISLGSLAVQVAKEHADEDSDVLLVGTGKMIQIAADEFSGRRMVYVASRRRTSPAWLKEGRLVGYGDIRRLARRCGIVIAATNAAKHVVRSEDLEGGKKVVVDLGMPRNVSPEARRLPGVNLFDLGDLASVARPQSRPKGLAGAQRTVDREAEEFLAWLVQTRLSSALSELHSWAGQVREEELLRAIRKLGDASPRNRRIVDAMGRRIVSRILARPTRFARGSYVGLTEDEKLKLLGSVFGLSAGIDGE